MSPGDVVYVASLLSLRQGMQMSFKAPKGKAFVVVLLGCHDRPQMHAKAAFEHFDAEAALRELGWIRNPELPA